jgi:hypothetical protein
MDTVSQGGLPLRTDTRIGPGGEDTLPPITSGFNEWTTIYIILLQPRALNAHAAWPWPVVSRPGQCCSIAPPHFPGFGRLREEPAACHIRRMAQALVHRGRQIRLERRHTRKRVRIKAPPPIASVLLEHQTLGCDRRSACFSQLLRDLTHRDGYRFFLGPPRLSRLYIRCHGRLNLHSAGMNLV